MRAIILAAGLGVRLNPLTSYMPKCLIELGSKSLLEHSLSAIERSKIKDVTIVLGHLGHQIKEKIGTTFNTLNVSYIENSVYASSGSMYSLWLALNQANDDIVFFDSDIIYEKRGIETVLSSTDASSILVTNLSGSGDEVYVCGKNGLVKECRKKPLKNIACVGEYVGIVKLSKDSQSVLQAAASEYFRQKGLKLEYEECISLCAENANIGYCYADNLVWTEIDNSADLERAKNTIFPRLQLEGLI